MENITGVRLFKTVAVVTIFSIVTRSLAFIFKIYLSRVLGAEAMGLYQMSLSLFYLFVALSSSGLVTVLSRRVAETKALDPKNTGYALLSSSLVIGLVLTIIIVIILLLCRPYISIFFPDQRAVPIFMIMLPALITTCIYGLIRSWFWGNKDFTAFSITELLEEVLRIGFSVLFVSGIVCGIYGENGIALAFSAADFGVALILTALFFLKGGRLKKPLDFKPLIKPAATLSTMRAFASIIGTIFTIMLPLRLVAGGFSISDATASYGRIAGMANPLLFAPNAIISSLALVLIPEMSASGIKRDNASVNRHIDAGISFAIIVSGVFLVVFASFGEELTLLLFNDSESGEYLRVAAWLLLIMPIHQISSSALNSIGMEKESFISYLISASAMLIIIYFLTPIIGIYAAVIANFVTLILCTIGNLFFLNKRLALSFRFIKPLAFIAGFSFPCILLGKNIHSLLQSISGIFALLAGISSVAILYCVLLSVTELINVKGFLRLRYKS
jgi:stage V sporulation protein B